MDKLFKTVAVLACLSGGFGISSAAHASVVLPDTTYYITANCEDCAAFANQPFYEVNAELTLSDYTEGTGITGDNFVSFFYAGSNLIPSFSVTPDGSAVNGATHAYTYGYAGDDVSGVIGGPFPSMNDFTLLWGDGLYFWTHTTGAWATCAHGFGESDYYYNAEECAVHYPDQQGQPTDYGNGAVYGNTPTNNAPEPGVLALSLAALGALMIARSRRQPA